MYQLNTFSSFATRMCTRKQFHVTINWGSDAEGHQRPELRWLYFPIKANESNRSWTGDENRAARFRKISPRSCGAARLLQIGRRASAAWKLYIN